MEEPTKREPWKVTDLEEGAGVEAKKSSPEA